MANYQALLDSIANTIKTNGNNEITGAILQGVLQSIVTTVGANATYGGVAHPNDNPGTPPGSVVYVASEAGTYTNFGALTLTSSELAILKWDTNSWTKESYAYIANAEEIDEALQDALGEIETAKDNAIAIIGQQALTAETISGSNVQLKDANDANIYPKTNLQMVDGYVAENYDTAYYGAGSYYSGQYYSGFFSKGVGDTVPSSKSWQSGNAILEGTCVAGQSFRIYGKPYSSTSPISIANVDSNRVIKKKDNMPIGEDADGYVFKCISDGMIICQMGTDNDTRMDAISYLPKLDNRFGSMVNDKKYPIFIDLGEEINYVRTTSYKSIIQITATTDTTATISSADATNMNMSAGAPCSMVFHFVENGKDIYKFYIVYCNGTTLTLANATGSLSGATECCSSYENSQHLSPYGYRAMAQIIAKQITMRNSKKKDNLLGGLFFSAGGMETVAYNNPSIRGTTSKTQIIYPYRSRNFTLGGSGATGGSFQIASNSSIEVLGMQTTTRLYAFQGKQSWAELTLPKLTGAYGYLTFECASRNQKSITTGRVQVDVYNGGVSILSSIVPPTATTFTTDYFKADDLKVRFTWLDAASAASEIGEVWVSYIAMYGMSASVPTKAIVTADKIAVVGDSWTQFPTTESPGVPSGDSDNTVDTLGDGRTANGYQYMVKELRRQLGCTITNFGKSGETITGFGFEKLKEVMAMGRWEYCLIEFWINDGNAGRSRDMWMNDMYAMMDVCISNGVTPILCVPCAQGTTGSELRRYLMLETDVYQYGISNNSYVTADLEERWQNRKNEV